MFLWLIALPPVEDYVQAGALVLLIAAMLPVAVLFAVVSKSVCKGWDF